MKGFHVISDPEGQAGYISTMYCPPAMGGLAWSVTNRPITIRTNCTLSKLAVRSTARNSAGLATVRTMVNGAVGSSVVTIPASTPGFHESATTDTLVAGDTLNIRRNHVGSATSTIRAIRFLLTPTHGGIMQIFGATAIGEIGGAALSYVAISDGLRAFETLGPAYPGGIMSVTEADAQVKMLIPGTFRNMQAWCPENGEGVTIRFRKNGANGNQVLSIIIATTVQEDTTNSDTVVAGDLVNFSVDNGGTAGSTTLYFITVEFESLTGRTSQVILGSSQIGVLPLSTPTYYVAGGAAGTTGDGSATESNILVTVGYDAVAHSMRTYTPTSASDETAMLRRNSADTRLTVAMPSGGGEDENTNVSDSVVYDAADTIGLSLSSPGALPSIVSFGLRDRQPSIQRKGLTQRRGLTQKRG